MRRYLVCLVLPTILTIAPSVWAQSAKPADVLLAVDQISASIDVMFKAAGKPVPEVQPLELAPRRPRHVYQKAREVFLKAQTLRRLNSLSQNPLPLPPSSEVTPGDVRNLVDLIKADIDALLPVYWVGDVAGEVPKHADVTPTDVYQGLHRVSVCLDRMGLPSVVPNEVHRLAVMIKGDMMELFRVMKGRSYDSGWSDPVSGKSPAQVFANETAFLKQLKEFVENDSKTDIPGGILLSPQPKGKISPAIVAELGNNILAELAALKVVYEGQTDLPLPEPSAGKTPSDVFKEIEDAKLILAALQ